MDFVQLLSQARVPSWVRYPNTTFELNVKKLTTAEIERCRKQGTKNNKVNIVNSHN